MSEGKDHKNGTKGRTKKIALAIGMILPLCAGATSYAYIFSNNTTPSDDGIASTISMCEQDTPTSQFSNCEVVKQFLAEYGFGQGTMTYNKISNELDVSMNDSTENFKYYVARCPIQPYGQVGNCTISQYDNSKTSIDKFIPSSISIGS